MKKHLVCTDVSATRLERLRIVLNGFAWGIGHDRPGFPSVEVYSTASLLRNSKNRGGQRFSRVLVDVPCSTDRDALTSISGGYFARGKGSERIGLPETQKRLLRHAMSLCDVGGYIVYSTCTLSMAQNQGVIESCLSNLNPRDDSNEDASFAVVDPTEFIDLCAAQLHPSLGVRIVPASNWNSGTPLGAMVIPRLAANYGPTFMCKIKRLRLFQANTAFWNPAKQTLDAMLDSLVKLMMSSV
ncbi:unnamed protein product [Hymenolepis diminuta]|uniref:NOL1/NOP2/Sun domain family member 4 n=1 Tax=Hymenolepis diminuta TaxID=6216 RepID=A0A0R3SHM4_HYMDI|nr:unnamed protein product [Hymenolepis diminuta]